MSQGHNTAISQENQNVPPLPLNMNIYHNFIKRIYREALLHCSDINSFHLPVSFLLCNVVMFLNITNQFNRLEWLIGTANLHWKKNWASFDTKRGVQIWVLRWTSKGDRVTPLKSVMTPWWCQFIVYTFGCSPEDPFLRVSNDTFSGVKVNLLGVNLLFTPLDVRLRTHF